MTAKEELIERLYEYNKLLKEKTKNRKLFTICTNPEIAKLFRQKLEGNNHTLK